MASSSSHQRRHTYCIAYNCPSTNLDGLTFFTLPKDTETCKAWLKLIQREDILGLVDYKTFVHKSYKICCKHFDKAAIKTIKRLSADAEPIGVGDIDQQPTTTRIKVEEDENIDIEEMQPFIYRHNITNSNDNEEGVLDILDKDFKELLKIYRSIKQKAKQDGNENELNYFALNLCIADPDMYAVLAKTVTLPSKKQLYTMKLHELSVVDNGVLNLISTKLRSLPDEARYCTLCIANTPIKKQVRYDVRKDEVLGLHKINGVVHTTEIAAYACTVMLRGIVVDWKIPVTYAALSNIESAYDIRDFLNEILSKLFQIGVKIMAVVSDGSPNFDHFAKNICKVSKEKPYFISNGQKIFYIYDVPELFTTLCKELITYNFVPEKGSEISWSYIEETFATEQQREFRIIPNLTHEHMTPDGIQELGVKGACQIFSKTMASALCNYINLLKLPNLPYDGLETVHFLEKMNNLFDTLNSSSNKGSNKFKTAFRLEDHQEKIIGECIKIFSSMKVKRRMSQNIQIAPAPSDKLPVFINFQITMHSILLLYHDLRALGQHSLFTRRLNLDPLNSLFQLGKERATLNTRKDSFQPTLKMFKFLFIRTFKYFLLKSVPGNSAKNWAILITEAQKYKELNPVVNREKKMTLNYHVPSLFSLPSSNGLLYLACYVFEKLATKHKCAKFEKYDRLTARQVKAIRRTFKEGYNKIWFTYKQPRVPPAFESYIRNLDEVFVDKFMKLAKSSPGQSLYCLLQEVDLEKPCECLPMSYVIKLFLRLRISNLIEYNNRITNLKTSLVVNSISSE